MDNKQGFWGITVDTIHALAQPGIDFFFGWRGHSLALVELDSNAHMISWIWFEECAISFVSKPSTCAEI